MPGNGNVTGNKFFSSYLLDFFSLLSNFQLVNGPSDETQLRTGIVLDTMRVILDLIESMLSHGFAMLDIMSIQVVFLMYLQ